MRNLEDAAKLPVTGMTLLFLNISLSFEYPWRIGKQFLKAGRRQQRNKEAIKNRNKKLERQLQGHKEMYSVYEE